MPDLIKESPLKPAFREITRSSPRGHRFLERTTPPWTLSEQTPDGDPYAFHLSLPGYRPSPLRNMEKLAAELGFERLWVKDEHDRLGLPAFKVLGASWAAFRSLSELFATSSADLTWPFRALTQKSLCQPAVRITTASAGNHGRAVARVARLFGCQCQITVPAGSARSRIEAIASEGATVEVWDGTYDEAVAAVAARAEHDPRTVVLADTSAGSHADVTRWVTDGYSTIFREIDHQLEGDGEPPPDVVFVQAGVGSLAAAVVAHYAAVAIPIITVEPLDANCVFETLLAGTSVTVPGPHKSIMAGLNAGVVSPTALPYLSSGVAGCCCISDDAAHEAVRTFNAHSIPAGATGAAGLAGLVSAVRDAPAAFRGLRQAWKRPLLIVTEGITDRQMHSRSLGGA